jgi:hypothetical protein
MAEYDENTIINCLTNYRREASMAKLDRMNQNKLNYETYHLRQDWSYKTKGQSKEFLPKMAMAVEQAANFLQQGLMDIGDWFKVEPNPGISEDALRVKPSSIYKLTDRQLQKAGFITKLNDAAKLGLIGSLIIAKVGGKYVNKPKFKAERKLKNLSFKKILVRKEEKVWQLDLQLVRQEDYYPDPTGRGLYEMQDIWMDYHEVEALAKGDDAIYDLEVVKQLQGQFSSAGADKEFNKARETGQNVTNHGFRKQIKVTEIWGNILSEEGDLIYENVVTTIANDRLVIQKPTPNPYWHGDSPFVKCAIVNVPHSVWGKALMDAPAMLNRAANEMFNLILDGGLMAVHGIKQIKEHYLEDASQVEDGITPGDTLRVNASCPPGESVLSRVDTSTVPQDGLNVLNLVNQELNVAAMTNDLRMGVASFRSVKATEVVEASQTISSMFSGMAKVIEGDENSGFITPLLQKSWKVIAQHINDLDSDEVKALLGRQVAEQLLAMGNEELFAETVQGCKFRTFGISATLNKQKDFQKMTALLQTIASSEPMMEAFIAKYDFTKYLTELMRSLDINTYKIEADPKAGGDLSQGQQPQQPGMAQGEQPNMQSQIPQAGAASQNVNPAASAAQPVQPSHFPPSKATPASVR